VFFENDLMLQKTEKRKERRQMLSLDSAFQRLESHHMRPTDDCLFQNASFGCKKRTA
jgi:hypothetical protein